MANAHDLALRRFIALRARHGGDDEAFIADAQALGHSADESAWILSVLGTAQFRAIYGRLLAAQTTDFENDPWFLAAQRHYAEPSGTP